MAMLVATQPAVAASMGGVTAVSILAAPFLCNFGGYAVLGTATRWRSTGHSFLAAMRARQATGLVVAKLDR